MGYNADASENEGAIEMVNLRGGAYGIKQKYIDNVEDYYSDQI